MNDKNVKLQQANDELEQFAYVLSHDLQEPLRKIQTFSNMVIEKAELFECKIYLEKIDNSTKRMKKLIQDVLDYSKLNNKSDMYAAIDLNLVLENVKNDLEIPITSKKAVIISALLPRIQGIEYQITQAFYNLIGNSIKYSTSEPRIEISSRYIDASGLEKRQIEILFKDNGIGFDEKYKEDIFTPFKRLQSNKEYEGTGIGLALVKTIVEGHRGKTSAESKAGSGSIFKMTFPTA